MSCGVGCRRGSDPVLLWLWRRLVATAPIRPLSWDSPYAVEASLEKAKRHTHTQKKKKKKKLGKITKESNHHLKRYIHSLLIVIQAKQALTAHGGMTRCEDYSGSSAFP